MKKSREITFPVRIACVELLWVKLMPFASVVISLIYGFSGTTLFSCRAMPRTDVDTALEARLARADRVFSLMERQCPKIFGPVPLATDIGDNVFQRRYANYDVRVSVSPKEGVTLTHFRSLSAITMGSIDHVIGNGGVDACTAWRKLNIQ